MYFETGKILPPPPIPLVENKTKSQKCRVLGWERRPHSDIASVSGRIYDALLSLGQFSELEEGIPVDVPIRNWN